MLPPLIHSTKLEMIHMAPTGWHKESTLTPTCRRPITILIPPFTFTFLNNKEDVAYSSRTFYTEVHVLMISNNQ